MKMRYRNLAQALADSMATDGYTGGGVGTYIPPDGALSPANTYVPPKVLPTYPQTWLQNVTNLIDTAQSIANTPVVQPGIVAPVVVPTTPQNFLDKVIAAIAGEATTTPVLKPVIAPVPAVIQTLQPISVPTLDYGKPVIDYNAPVPSTAPIKTIVPTATYTDPGLDSTTKPVIFQKATIPQTTYQDPLIGSGSEAVETIPLKTDYTTPLLLGVGALGLLLLLVKR